MSAQFYSDESERCVLAKILTEGFDSLPEAVSPDCFGNATNRAIYEAAFKYWGDGRPTDYIAISQALGASGQLEAVGGVAYLTGLFMEPISASAVESAISTLKEKRNQRRAREAFKAGLDEIDAGGSLDVALSGVARLADESSANREPRIAFFSPGELRRYSPENDQVFVGDCHIMRGEIVVIGGAPGVGKSLLATELAFSGATGEDWLGLKVHRRFRTLIVQNENGRYRLQQEYAARRADVDAWIRVSEPPPFRISLAHPEFQADFRRELARFKPEVVVLDPWNAAARDDKQRDYSETFDALRALLPTGPDKPALVIVAHTRKPQANERRTGGNSLLNILAGSHILASVPRCVFVAVHASDEETCQEIVVCNPKNSNGPKCERTAWRRDVGGFTAVPDFDWQTFDADPEKRRKVSEDDIRDVLTDGPLPLKEAAEALAERAGIGVNAARNALSEKGKFSHLIDRTSGLLRLRRVEETEVLECVGAGQ